MSAYPVHGKPSQGGTRRWQHHSETPGDGARVLEVESKRRETTVRLRPNRTGTTGPTGKHFGATRWTRTSPRERSPGAAWLRSGDAGGAAFRVPLQTPSLLAMLNAEDPYSASPKAATGGRRRALLRS